MFGILSAPCRVHSPYLSGEYQPFYCGLASALEKLFGYPARVLAGRDAVVLSILRSALAHEPPILESRRCCNLLGKARIVCLDSHTSEFAAATTILGLQTKLEDNVQDEAGIARLASRIGSWVSTSRLFGSWTGKAEGILSTQGVSVERIREALRSQREREASFQGEVTALEVPAAPTGVAFGELCGAGLSGEAYDESYRCGYALGEVFYVVDAWRDLRRDIQRGRFNPLACHPRFATVPTVRIPEELTSWFQIRFRSIEESLKRLPLARHRSLLEYILLTSLSPTLGLGRYREDDDRSNFPHDEERRKRREQNGCRKQCQEDCNDCAHFCGRCDCGECDPCQCCGIHDNSCHHCCIECPGLDCCDCCDCGSCCHCG